ncbi:MAG: hypothetical protein FWH07_07515 [Oscillospiraceae bacterium]|nr:hypothetical protein [Oscillospiraceae bacterium]
MAVNKKSVTVRFYLDKPFHRKAYNCLKSQTEFSTVSAAIITAVIDYFDNQERENRLVEKIKSALTGVTVLGSPSIAEIAESEAEQFDDIDFDFCGS